METLNGQQQEGENQTNSAYGIPKIEGEITFTHKQLEGTIFQLLWKKDQGFALGIGNKRITQWIAEEEQLLDRVYRTDWELIMAVIEIITEYKLEEKELERRIGKTEDY